MKTLIVSFILCCVLHSEDINTLNDSYNAIARFHGWSQSFKRGNEILHELASIPPDELKISAYRGEIATFIGGSAPPGGTNDLITKDGYYLRIVNTSGKDLRPRAVLWSAMIQGKILQIFPKNKIILIEVDDANWRAIETG